MLLSELKAEITANKAVTKIKGVKREKPPPSASPLSRYLLAKHCVGYKKITITFKLIPTVALLKLLRCFTSKINLDSYQIITFLH